MLNSFKNCLKYNKNLYNKQKGVSIWDYIFFLDGPQMFPDRKTLVYYCVNPIMYIFLNYL